MNRMWVSALSASLVWSGSLARSAEPESVLDWIPDNAAFTFFVRNRAEFDRKWTKVADAAGIKGEVKGQSMFDFPLLPKFFSDGVVERMKDAGVSRGTDPDGPLVATVIGSFPFDSSTVLAVRVKDFGSLRAGMGALYEHWKPGEAVVLGTKFQEFAIVSDGILFVGDKRRDVRREEFKPLGRKLPAARRELLLGADCGLHVRPAEHGLFQNIAFLYAPPKHRHQGPNDEGATLELKQFAFGIESIDVAVRFDNGMQVDAAAYPVKPSPLLETLVGGPCDLAGLPDRDPLLAFAEKGRGKHAARTFRWMIGLAAHATGNCFHPSTVEQFESLRDNLVGSRVAFHRTAAGDAAKFGRQSLVAILDVDNPDDAPRAAEALARLAFHFSIFKPEVAVRLGIDKTGPDDVHAAVIDPTSRSDAERSQAAADWGPDWHRIRFVSIGKQVVVLVGSDQSLLAEAVANVRNRRPGLAGSPKLQSNLSPNRRFELHFCFAALAGLSKDPAPPATDYTSVAVEVEPSRLGLQIRVPPTELKSWLDRGK